MDAPENIAFDPRAPLPERFDAQSVLQQTYLPTASELIPAQTLMPIIEAIKGAAEERELIKSAQVIQGPWRGPSAQGRLGLRSVNLDRLQIFAYADFWDKPANASFDLLRSMVDQTPVLSGIVLTRLRQISRFTQPQEDDGPGFVIRHIERDHAVSTDEAASILALTSFIRNGGWERDPRKRKRMGRDTFAQFMAKSVRDSLTLDAAPIETETKRDSKLGLDGFYAVDGATIRLCTEDGYRGDDEIFAVQVLQNSNIVTAYTYDDLVYEVRNPRSDVRLSGYGLSETELLIRCVTGFLNAMTYNAKGFDDNAIPRGLLHLSGDYSDNDLAAFRRYWNAMVKGISNAWTLPVLVSKDQESKASFERFGIEFNEMYFSKWMTFLASLICAIYGMSPDEINFESFSAGRSSLSGSDTSEKLADSKDKGLRPLMAYYESLISDYIIQVFSDKYCFRWAGLDEEDQEKRHEMRKLVLTVNEVRAQEGYGKLDGPLGDAPLNPSLIGLYQQQTQPPQQPSFGDRGPQQEDHGGESGPGGYDDTDDGEKEDGDQEEGDGSAGNENEDGEPMGKANPNHGERVMFASWAGIPLDFGTRRLPGGDMAGLT